MRHGTVARDKHYGMRRCVRRLRAQGLTPHVAAYNLMRLRILGAVPC